MRQEAIAECERCQGRRHGDCDSACRYFFAQTRQEARDTKRLRLKGRGWIGAVFHGLEEPHE